MSTRTRVLLSMAASLVMFAAASLPIDGQVVVVRSDVGRPGERRWPGEIERARPGQSRGVPTVTRPDGT